MRLGKLHRSVSPWPRDYPELIRQIWVSQTTYAEYHGFGFWVFDVCASILFAEMATVASQRPKAERFAWLADLEHQLRVHAIVSDFAIPLDE